MDGLRVKVLLLRFQFICTKTIRRLDPLRVNIVSNKGQDPHVTTPRSWIFLRINSEFCERERGKSTQAGGKKSAKCSPVGSCEDKGY